MVDIVVYKDGASADDAMCGHIRAAASVASAVFARLPGAQGFLGDQGPQALSGLTRILALKGEETVGFVDFNPLDGYVKMLFVAPSAQGQGVAGSLLSEAAGRSEAPLNLRTQAVNDGALAFYLGQGFEVTAGVVEANWHGARVVWLSLCRERAS